MTFHGAGAIFTCASCAPNPLSRFSLSTANRDAIERRSGLPGSSHAVSRSSLQDNGHPDRRRDGCHDSRESIFRRVAGVRCSGERIEAGSDRARADIEDSGSRNDARAEQYHRRAFCSRRAPLIFRVLHCELRNIRGKRHLGPIRSTHRFATAAGLIADNHFTSIGAGCDSGGACDAGSL